MPVVARVRRKTAPSCVLAWTLSSEDQYGAATFQNLRSSVCKSEPSLCCSDSNKQNPPPSKNPKTTTKATRQHKRNNNKRTDLFRWRGWQWVSRRRRTTPWSDVVSPPPPPGSPASTDSGHCGQWWESGPQPISTAFDSYHSNVTMAMVVVVVGVVISQAEWEWEALCLRLYYHFFFWCLVLTFSWFVLFSSHFWWWSFCFHSKFKQVIWFSVIVLVSTIKDAPPCYWFSVRFLLSSFIISTYVHSERWIILSRMIHIMPRNHRTISWLFVVVVDLWWNRAEAPKRQKKITTKCLEDIPIKFWDKFFK